MRTRTRFTALILFACLAAPAALPAQAPRPLDKIEVIRLLTNPLFAPSEVADVVRRSCVAFHPTDRDWADLRTAGASGEVIATVAACTTRRTEPAAAVRAAPPAALTAVAVTPDVAVNVGAPASVRVFVHRGGVPQRRVTVMLRGSAAAVGLQRDATGTTDDSGVAMFPLPPVAQPGTHRFEIVGSSGSTFPGRPGVTLVVRAGEPARLRVSPDYIASVETGTTLLATVTDSLGNPLPREPVEMTSGVGAPISVPTDSLGRASFTVAPGTLPRGGALQLRVRKLAAIEVPVADAAGLSGTLTGFIVPASIRRARVGTTISDPVVFRVRTVQGNVPTGRVVRFRALNARVRPDSAVLDSTGRVPLEVTFGSRVGEALVFATIDSVEKLVSFQVDPGPISTLVVEYNGQPVTPQGVTVRVAAPFVLRVTARDLFGNETSIDALAQMLRSRLSNPRQRYLEIVGLDPGDQAVLITLKAQRIGVFDFTIGSGITASVRVEAVAR
jgi:hypothetical protein